jgi:hypothetical protein
MSSAVGNDNLLHQQQNPVAPSWVRDLQSQLQQEIEDEYENSKDKSLVDVRISSIKRIVI